MLLVRKGCFIITLPSNVTVQAAFHVYNISLSLKVYIYEKNSKTQLNKMEEGSHLPESYAKSLGSCLIIRGGGKFWLAEPIIALCSYTGSWYSCLNPCGGKGMFGSDICRWYIGRPSLAIVGKGGNELQGSESWRRNLGLNTRELSWTYGTVWISFLKLYGELSRLLYPSEPW